MAEKFAQEITDSLELQTNRADHQRRSQRAKILLTTSQIPYLTEDKLKELFFDSDAFRFWKNKDWEFNNRLQKVGLDGLKQSLIELVSRAERGLTTEDLKYIWDMKGLGVLLATELLSYRFPLEYWAYNKNVTLLALQELGEDIKSIMPHGQRSNPYLYLAIEPQIAEVRQALSDAGLIDIDNLIVDVFLWWLSKSARPTEEVTRYWKISPGRSASFWDEFQSREIIAVDGSNIGDIHQLSPNSIAGLKEEIRKSNSKADGQSLGYATKQLWMFYHDMKPGDLVCAYGQKNVVGWGEITGDYEYQEDDLSYCHRRTVKWLSNDSISVDSLSPELKEKLQQVRTIVELTSEDFEEIKSAVVLETSDLVASSDNEPQAIKEVDTSIIEQAMRDFDANQRGEEEWKGWESNRTHKYAIYWQEQHYPVKEIIRMATGTTIFHSAQARPYLEKHGFQIIPLRSDLSEESVFDQEQNILDRKSEESVRQVIESLLPDVETRKICLNAFADSIITAHQLGANKWSITLYNHRIRLNVGRIVVCALHDKKFWAAFDSGSLSDADRTSLNNMVKFETAYKSIPSSIASFIELVNLAQVIPILRQAHAELLKKAASGSTYFNKRMLNAHSPGVTAYLRNYLGKDIPDPAYVVDKIDDNELVVEEETILATPNTLTILTKSFTDKGLNFTTQQIATFYTALQVKGFVILSGISGTGKTKLAQHFASLLPQPIEVGFSNAIELESTSSLSGNLNTNWLFMSVRPDWRDSKSLLGYYNPLIGNYEWTPFLRFLLKVVSSYKKGDGLAWFVLLDEMNLAHVEYYFADILSVIESGRERGWSREPLRFVYPEDAKGNLPPAEIFLPPNLYFVGTVNIDETTHAFSPKVLDRAFTLELTEADFSTYFPNVAGKEVKLNETIQQRLLEHFTFNKQFANITKQCIGNYLDSKPQVRVWLQNLNSSLRQYNMHFGYRVFDEIVAFLSVAESNKLFEDLGGFEAAFDLAILMKVLPKFHGSRGKLEAPLCVVLAWCIDPDTPQEETISDALKGIETSTDLVEELEGLKYRYPATAERVRRMLYLLYIDGFAAFG